MENQVIGFVALKDLYASNNDFCGAIEESSHWEHGSYLG